MLCRVGLAGTLLPESLSELNLDWGVIRRSDERDGRLIPATALTGEVASVADDGTSIVMRYRGDLVLEFNIPYRIEIAPPGAFPPYPSLMSQGHETMQSFVEDVQSALILGMPERRIVVVPMWWSMLDPLAPGMGTSWRAFTSPNLTPTQLSMEQAATWQHWIGLIKTHRIPSIDVSMRRLLSASTERTAPEDVLIDAVVVWENLFGAKAETTLRISSSLAWLLGDSPPDRLIRQTMYKKIYSLRSDVVHGAPNLKMNEIQSSATDALSVSVAALRALFTSHTSLLTFKSSEERSRHIMLGDDGPTSS
jgi:Apea-like HEPN